MLACVLHRCHARFACVLHECCTSAAACCVDVACIGFVACTLRTTCGSSACSAMPLATSASINDARCFIALTSLSFFGSFASLHAPFKTCACLHMCPKKKTHARRWRGSTFLGRRNELGLVRLGDGLELRRGHQHLDEGTILPVPHKDCSHRPSPCTQHACTYTGTHGRTDARMHARKHIRAHPHVHARTHTPMPARTWASL